MSETTACLRQPQASEAAPQRLQALPPAAGMASLASRSRPRLNLRPLSHRVRLL